MVKYLGVDYLKLAISQKQQFLNQALIAVPEHLEVVDLYTHCGKLEDERFRYPWKRASCDSGFLNDERSKVSTLEMVVPIIRGGDGVEKYDCDSEDEDLGYFDLNGFVPSSNPDSPLANDIQHSENSTGVMETHRKLDLEDGKINCIEEPLEQEMFSSLKKNLPSLKCLTERLHQSQIKDPFSAKTINSIENGHCLRLTSSELSEKPTSKEFFSESLDKIAVQDGVHLEEIMSPFTDVQDEQSLGQSCVLTDLSKITSADSVTEELPFPPCIVNLNQQAEILQKEDSCNEKMKSFLNINGIGDDHEINETKALLDSPVISTTSIIEPGSLHIKSMLQSLPRIEISGNNLSRFLSNGEVEKMEFKIWQKEKYFCDILSLRITEPDVEVPFESHTSLKSVIEQLKWVKKESVSDIELSLNWDPVGHISTSKNILEKIEIAKKDVKWEVKKQEEKFTCHKLVDWRDDVIERTETDKVNLQVKGYENKVLEFGTSIAGLETKNVKTVEDFGFDQIDDFFTLRFGKKAEQKQAQVTSGHISKGLKEEEIKEINSSNCSIHCDMVLVQLGDKIQDIIITIDKKLSYLQSALKAARVSLPNQELSALNTDFTRFLLKQTEKQMLDSAENEEIEETYKSVVCLHALVGARDILYNYCLESAIAHLQAVEEKYKSGVTAGIEDVRQKLFQLSSSFQQKKVYHPKVIATSVEIEKCLNSKGTLKRKVLVIIKRNLPSFLSVLKEVASHSAAVRFKVQEDSQTESIISSLEEHNCMVITECLISSDFPWSMFNLVIEYQYEEKSAFYRICEMQNLKLKALKLDLKSIEKNHQQEMQLATVASSFDNLPQRTIIGSTQLTACGDVLPLLETRYNLTVIERNYNIFDKSVFADIDMTDRSGIILHSMKELSDENQMERLLKKIISLSVKYTKCWILLFNLSKTAKSYPYAGKYVRNLCKLQASLGNYVGRHDSFEAKILSCYTAEEACSCIRSICDTEMNSSEIWNSEEWRDGNWLKEYPTKEEKLLLTLPCINSISSQILLMKLSLKELISASQEDLIRIFPMIARRLLLELFSILHSNQGLNSRLDSCKTDSKLIKQNTISQSSVNEHWNDNQNKEKIEHEKREAVDNLNCDQSNNKKSECQENSHANQWKERIQKNNLSHNANQLETDFDQDISMHQKSKVSVPNYSFDTSDTKISYDSRHLGTFPEKSYKLKFGRTHSSSTDTCELHQRGLYHENYPNEEKDTQDTDDVLSLNGSQSSVLMNEFEKAEIEGTLNRISNKEIVSGVERDHLLRNDDINNMLTRHKHPDGISDIRYAETNPRHLQYSNEIDGNKHESDPKYLNYSNGKDRNKYESDPRYLNYSNEEVRNKHDFDTDYSQYGISNHHPIDSGKYLGRSKNTIENQEIMIYGSQHIGGQKVDMFPENGKSQYLTPNDFPGISSAKKSGENRSFTQDLSETTRNILKQAYQSPRFGVRPTRPFTQRISVGLAQPLRRETTSKTSSDDRNNNARLHTTQNTNTATDRMSNLRQTQREISEHREYIGKGDQSMYCENKLPIQGETPRYRGDFEAVENENRSERPEEYRSNNSSRSGQSKYFNDRTNLSGFCNIQQANFDNRHDNNGTQNARPQSIVDLNTQFSELDDYCQENYKNYRINNMKDSKLSGPHGTGFEFRNKTLKTPRQLIARTEQDRAYRPQRQWQDYDSPPMDLDYLNDLEEPQMLKQKTGYSSDSLLRETSDMTNRMYLTNDRSVPNKKRKLAYQKQPGSRGGQTKLVFK